MCRTINTPVCRAQFLKQKNFALDVNARKVFPKQNTRDLLSSLQACSPEGTPGSEREVVLISGDSSRWGFHNCFGGKEEENFDWRRLFMLTTHNSRHSYSAVTANPLVLQAKYVTGSNYRNKNMCFNLTYRQNFSYYCPKSWNCQGLFLKY